MSLYDPKTTALISIDLQGLVVGRELAPYSAQQVIENTAAIATHLKSQGGTVILVTVEFSPDYADAVNQPVDEAMSLPPGGLPACARFPRRGHRSVHRDADGVAARPFRPCPRGRPCGVKPQRVSSLDGSKSRPSVGLVEKSWS